MVARSARATTRPMEAHFRFSSLTGVPGRGGDELRARQDATCDFCLREGTAQAGRSSRSFASLAGLRHMDGQKPAQVVCRQFSALGAVSDAPPLRPNEHEPGVLARGRGRLPDGGCTTSAASSAKTVYAVCTSVVVRRQSGGPPRGSRRGTVFRSAVWYLVLGPSGRGFESRRLSSVWLHGGRA